MRKITLRHVPAAVAAKEEFDCNGTLYSVNDGGKYIVYSYGKHFPVAMYRDGAWTYNSDRYSPTTGRHQSMVRMGIGSNYTSVDTDTIKGLL